jgi:hypothetical protein
LVPGFNETAVYPLHKEYMMKYRLHRTVYLLSLIAALAMASGAGKKWA